jgi:hypothetical protein
MSLVDENARSWSSSKDSGIGFTGGLNNCKPLAHMEILTEEIRKE